MSLSEKVNRTQFFVDVFTINQKFTFDQLFSSVDSDKDHMDIGTISEKYAKKILFSFIDLTSSINTLEEIPIFFSITKIPAFYLKNGISEIQYYKYHLENHYIKIASILDFTAHFVNEVYRLGIPGKKCNAFTVTENLNVKGTEVGSILQRFASHFQDLKSKRNIIIHKGKHQSEEIKSIESSIFSSKLMKQDKFLMQWFAERKNKEIKKVMDMFEANNKSVTDFLADLAQHLIIPFHNNYNYLKSLEETEGSPKPGRLMAQEI